MAFPLLSGEHENFRIFFSIVFLSLDRKKTLILRGSFHVDNFVYTLNKEHVLDIAPTRFLYSSTAFTAEETSEEDISTESQAA